MSTLSASATTSSEPKTTHPKVRLWVNEMKALCQPDNVYWCDGSEAEFQTLKRELVAAKELLPLPTNETASRTQ